MTTTIDAYPLTWPPGWPRTSYRGMARFQVTVFRAYEHLIKELERLSAAYDAAKRQVTA